MLNKYNNMRCVMHLWYMLYFVICAFFCDVSCVLRCVPYFVILLYVLYLLYMLYFVVYAVFWLKLCLLTYVVFTCICCIYWYMLYSPVYVVFFYVVYAICCCIRSISLCSRYPWPRKSRQLRKKRILPHIARSAARRAKSRQVTPTCQYSR